MNFARIQVDYDKLTAISRIFAEQEQRIRVIETQLKSHLSILKRGGWLGDNARPFYRRMDQDLMPAVIRAEKAMLAASQTVMEMIAVYRQGEIEAELVVRRAVQAESVFRLGGIGYGLDTTGLIAGRLLREGLAFAARVGDNFTDSDYLSQFRTPAAVMGMLGNFTLVNSELGQELLSGVFDYGAYGTKNDFSLSSIPESIVSSLSEKGAELVLNLATKGLGTVVMLGNDALQLHGAVSNDVSVLWRDLITGFTHDNNLLSYTNMTHSIETFRAALDDADLGNVFDGIGKVATDIYLDPLMNRSDAFVQDPSLSRFGDLTMSLFTRTVQTPFSMPVMLHEQLSDPGQFQETLRNTAGLVGDVMDVATGLPSMPAAYTELNLGMAIGTGQRLIEVLPIGSAAKDAILEQSQRVMEYTDDIGRLVTRSMGGDNAVRLLEINREIDFSESLQDLVDSMFPRGAHGGAF